MDINDAVGVAYHGIARSRGDFTKTERAAKHSTPIRIGHELVRFISYSTSTKNISSPVLGGNELRRFLTIQNTGAVTVFLGFGNKADSSGYQIPVNSEVTFAANVVPYNEVNIFSSTAGSVVIIEGSAVYA